MASNFIIYEEFGSKRLRIQRSARRYRNEERDVRQVPFTSRSYLLTKSCQQFSRHEPGRLGGQYQVLTNQVKSI